jgi:hypothetical protein
VKEAIMGTAIYTGTPGRVVAGPEDVAAPAANTPAVVTYAAASGRGHVVGQLFFGYDGAPTAGKLTIEDGAGNVVFQLPVTSAGVGPLNFTPAKEGSPNTAMIITLAAGGSSVKGYVSATHWTESA